MTWMPKAILVTGFAIAFGAGMTVGVQWRGQTAQAAPATTRPTSRGVGYLTAELNLTPDQQEKMKDIWSEAARRGGREQEERRRAHRKERDDAIAALVRPEDRERYDQVLRTYADRNAAMEREWRGKYQESVERTKDILTADQRKKYDEILKRQENRRADDRATSRPGSDKPN
jgi:Spy/CpxP family protein refolding chaperone